MPTLPPAERRALRFRRRSIVQRTGDALAAAAGSWDGLDLSRFCKCGRTITSDEGASVRVRHGDDGPSAYLVGVSTCGSVWSCAVCSAKIRTRRQLEVQLVATAHTAAGGHVGMMTLTVRHLPEHTLSQLMDAQASAWRSLQQSAGWRDLRQAGGLVGTVRSWEITHGFIREGNRRGSWHPHFHVLMLWDDSTSPADAARAVEWIRSAWAQRVENALGCRPNDHGFDYRAISANAAEYVAKIANEMTRADLKGSSGSIWHLVDGLEDGESWFGARVFEYMRATKGRRAIQFSRGLRALYGLDPEKSDDELAAELVEGEHVMDIGKGWLRRLNMYRRGRPPRIIELLQDIENSARAERLRQQTVDDVAELVSQTASAPPAC